MQSPSIPKTPARSETEQIAIDQVVKNAEQIEQELRLELALKLGLAESLASTYTPKNPF